MSRINMSGEHYDIAFGVDHVTGPFVQLWVKPAEEQDGCCAKIDGMCVWWEGEIPEALKVYLGETYERFYEFPTKPMPLTLSEQTVIGFANAVGGFPDNLPQEVYKIFGEEV